MNTIHSRSQKPIIHTPGKRKVFMLFVLAVVVSISTFAFGRYETPNWKLDATVKNVDFYHAVSVCNNKKAVFLRFVNKNSKPVTVSFTEVLKTSAGTNEIPLGGKKKITLQPGETLATNCSENTCAECLLLPEQAVPTHKVEVKDFEFKELQVNL